MSFFTNSLVFKVLNAFIRTLIASEIKNEDLPSIDNQSKVVYALSSESIIDLVSLNIICSNNNLPTPIDTYSKNFICLRSPKYVVAEQRFKRQKAQNLEAILDLQEEVTIVPVSISWGNRPEKEQSFFKMSIGNVDI